MMTHFEVKNYKCLADCSLPLTPLHVIIGQNDSGKTSLLEAILTLFRSTSQPLASAFPGEWKGKELVFEKAEQPRIVFDAAFSGSLSQVDRLLEYHLEVEFRNPDRSCRLYNEWFKWAEDRIETIEYRHNQGFSGVGARLQPHFAPEMRPEADLVHETIGSAQFYRLEPKVMALPSAIDPNRKFRLDQDGFGLPGLLDDILGYDAELFLKLRHTFCSFFPQFKSVRVETEAGFLRTSDEIGLRQGTMQNAGKGIYLTTHEGSSIRAQQASDGVLLFLGLLAIIYTPQPPKLLLIEEPEKGVYPKRLEEIIGIIRGLEEESLVRTIPQVILTTHSPFLLSAFQPEEVTFLSREGGVGPARARPLRDAPKIAERLGNGEFYLGELWYNLTEEELFHDA